MNADKATSDNWQSDKLFSLMDDDDDEDDDDRDDYGARAGDESKNETDKSTESLCQVQVSKQLKWVKNSSESY